MRPKAWHLALSALALLAASPLPGAQVPDTRSEAEVPVVQSFALANGLRVRLLEQHENALLRMELIIRTDFPEDAPGRAGLSLWLEGVQEASGAGPWSSAASWASAREENGVAFRWAHAPGLWTWSLHCDSRAQDLAMDHLAHAVFRPNWDPVRVHEVREQRLRVLLDEPPSAQVERRFRALLGLEEPERPEASFLRAATLADLAAHRRRLLRPERAELFIAGDMNLSQARVLARLHFGTWGEGGAAPLPADRPAPPRSVHSPAALTALELRCGALVGNGPGDLLLEEILRALEPGALPVRAPIERLEWGFTRSGERLALWLKARALPGAGVPETAGALQEAWSSLRERAQAAAPGALKVLQRRQAAEGLHPAERVERLRRGEDLAGSGLPAQVLGRWPGPGDLRWLAQGPAELRSGLEKAGLGPLGR